ncbi:MAG: UDP-N-acetylmuramoyl-L-alanyl-D-glutamate--2,6-diaminopimelate ligase [Desulfamplus sp.]|nr:UDP-N-acetylmuramoyl-L-alanyl-D-glutamate--2,6-diaminopimelate ligase [Desulfamplus sp.]
MNLSCLIKNTTQGKGKKISLLENVASEQYQDIDVDITSIHANAGEVKPGGLFIAIKGFKADGHDYIEQAIANGAAAVVIQHSIEKQYKTVVIEVQDTRKAMSEISASFYGYPSESMVLIGITGTNGKTTTAYLLESILKSGGYKTGVIGTVNFRYEDKIFDNPVTTPESIDLQRILNNMRDAGVTHVVMEVSSHAIDLHRVRDCSFDVGVFTNLTQDHLDYHKSMDAYFSCKKRLFTEQLKRGKKAQKSTAVINVNDSYGQIIVNNIYNNDNTNDTCTRIITTGTAPTTEYTKTITEVANLTTKESSFTTKETPSTKFASDQTKSKTATTRNKKHTPHIFSSDITDDISGLRGNIHIGSECTIEFQSRLTGLFNLENILCAAGSAHALGIHPEIIKKGIESCHGVPGRLERVENLAKRYVFVDYAHTPDALESILKTLRMRAPARLITIFGCGGDRDKSKRPIMGEIACKYSDITIVTSDNPRSEDPKAIISEILEGIKNINMHRSDDALKKTCSYENSPFNNSCQLNNSGWLYESGRLYESGQMQIIVEPDRAKALETAVRISQANDIIVAAGKGHETYQITAQGKIDFDDRVVLGQALIKHAFVMEN